MAAIEALRSASRIPIELHLDGGVPEAARFDVAVTGDTPEAQATDFLRTNRTLYGLDAANVGFTPRSISKVESVGLTGVHVAQSYRGLPVLGADMTVILGDGRALGTAGRLRPDVQVDTHPTITSAAAQVAAGLKDAVRPGVGATTLMVFDPAILGPGALGDQRSSPRLVWRVAAGASARDVALVDAHDGEVVVRLPASDDADIEVYSVDNANEVSEGIGCNELFEEVALGDDETTRAYDYFGLVSNWYLTHFKRDSWDGHGATITVHTKTRLYDTDGVTPFPNAQWTTPCELWEFSPGWVQLDVAAHEFQHGVTYAMAGIEHFWVSGALNESYSDIFAMFITGQTNLTFPNGGNRNLADPTLSSQLQPNRLSKLISPVNRPLGDDLWEDSGWVHRNTGISNLAAALMYRGGTHPVTGVVVADMPDNHVESLYYNSLALMPSEPGFSTQRVIIEGLAAASGYSEAEQCSVRNAFGAVEVGAPDQDCNGQPDTEADFDHDSFYDLEDNCKFVANPYQQDWDGDTIGDACDDDLDGDLINQANTSGIPDNCPKVKNPKQEDFNLNGVGTACDPTEDGDVDDDGFEDTKDNCPRDKNPTQYDTDADGAGDACDPDLDGDGVSTDDDNCPDVKNGDQADADHDMLGTACDPCPDTADGAAQWTSIDYFDADGNVKTEIGPKIADSDGDGIGDACDPDTQGINAILSILESVLPPSVDATPSELTLSGAAGGIVGMLLPTCAAPCNARPSADSCVEARVLDADATTRVSIVDDQGRRQATSDAGPEQRLAFNASSGTSYSLVLERLNGSSGDDSLRLRLGRCVSSEPPDVEGPIYITGHASIDLDFAGEAFHMDGGTCEIVTNPALEGSWVFGLSIGEPVFDTGISEDYFALGIVLPTAAPNAGLYSGNDVFASGSRQNHMFELSNLAATLDMSGANGKLIATEAATGDQVTGEFHC
jgi:Zn-dependent metalloprotease